MVALVAMTTPWLLLAGSLAHISKRYSRALLGLAGVSLLLVAAAGFGIVPHAHAQARISGYTLMFS